jgi:hypothetical protein
MVSYEFIMVPMDIPRYIPWTSPVFGRLRTMSFLQVVRREVAPLGTLGTLAVEV